MVEAERGRSRLEVAAIVEDVDAALRRLESPVAVAREGDAALVQLERGLERQIAVLDLLDDAFELGDGGLEILDRGIPEQVGL